jgi:hypothetical protein
VGVEIGIGNRTGQRMLHQSIVTKQESHVWFPGAAGWSWLSLSLISLGKLRKSKPCDSGWKLDRSWPANVPVFFSWVKSDFSKYGEETHMSDDFQLSSSRRTAKITPFSFAVWCFQYAVALVHSCFDSFRSSFQAAPAYRFIFYDNSHLNADDRAWIKKSRSTVENA